MGLDVSLKYCADRTSALAKQEQAAEHSSKLWEEAGSYDSIPDAKKDEIREAIRKFNEELGLDEWGSSNDIEGIELDSKTHPEHMFKIGYLRSSYNSGGINSVLKRAGCMDLYDIFEPEDGEYYVDINWHEAQQRCEAAIAEYTAHLTGPMAGYDCMRVTDFGHGGVKDDSEALQLLKKQLEEHPAGNGFRSYGNRDGDWFLDGTQVVGIVPNRGFGGGVFVLTKEPAKPIEEDWYLQALVVTKEMIDHVVAQKDPENYFLGWSA